MPSQASVRVTNVYAGNPIDDLARVQGLSAGAYLKQADITSISYSVYDLDNGSAVVKTGTLVVSSTIYDSLQVDKSWTKDNIGYNFKAALPATCFPLAVRRYRVVYSFVTVSWGTVQDVAEFHTISPTGA